MKRGYYFFGIAIIVVFVPIVLNFFIGLPALPNILVVGDASTWVVYWGSYIGGILAAGIGFLSILSGVRHNTLNLMIQNQENYIKELQLELSKRLELFNFSQILRFILREHSTVCQKDIVEELYFQHDCNVKVTAQANAWGLDGKSLLDRASGFNDAYTECVKAYLSGIDKMTIILKEGLKCSSNGKYENIIDVVKMQDLTKSSGMDGSLTKALFVEAKSWVKVEEDMLKVMKKEKNKIFPSTDMDSNK